MHSLCDRERSATGIDESALVDLTRIAAQEGKDISKYASGFLSFLQLATILTWLQHTGVDLHCDPTLRRSTVYESMQ